MAKTYSVSPSFLEYQKMIASSPVYMGMPDLYNSDGSIQWEAPSNRAPGSVHADTHDKRLKWWRCKALSIGIDPSQPQWISKVAKRIHPTKIRPCKFCGRVMSIEYCYLSVNLIKRIQKHPFFQHELDNESFVQLLSETTSVFELVSFLYDNYGPSTLQVIPDLLQCSVVPQVPVFNDFPTLLKWLKDQYVPAEPNILGPGAMSNAPDRLDGFHSFNRCCRKAQDKGRSQENLASYSSDRRAFENWSDGNWIEANRLMGWIVKTEYLRNSPCRNFNQSGTHTPPCSADHIGPISLGFAHRPVFQLLCKSCNSAKNNRMYLSDVVSLRADETNGEVVVSWYAKPVWDRLKGGVQTESDAAKLSRIMRDNRHTALSLLDELFQHKQYFLLLSLLNLGYAEYSYDLDPMSVSVVDHVVRASFKRQPSTTLYVDEQKARKIRVAFESLVDYREKELSTDSARNGLIVVPNNCLNVHLSIEVLLKDINAQNEALLNSLHSCISTKGGELLLRPLLPKIAPLLSLPEIIQAKDLLNQYMSAVADVFVQKWNDPRYSRESVE